MSTYQTDQQKAYRRYHRRPRPALEVSAAPPIPAPAGAPEAPAITPPAIDGTAEAHKPGGIREHLHNLFG